MSSRGILNCALLILVVGLGALVYFQPGLDKKQQATLTTLTPEKIQRIEIGAQGAQTITLVKEQNAWRMTAPIQISANEFRIESILGLLGAQSHTQYKKTQVDLAKLKLDTPRYLIRFNDLSVALGDTEPLEGRRYVLIGDVIHLIADAYSHHLTQGTSGFVSLKLLPQNSRIVALTLPTFSLTQTDGRWKLSPEQNVSADKTNALIDAWRTASTRRVEPWTETDAHQGKIIISLKDQPNAINYLILATSPELILARPDIGMAYHFDKARAKALLELPADSSAENPPSAPAQP